MNPNRTKWNRIGAALAALAITLTLGTAALADTVTPDNVAAKIAAAKTPADHEAIAAFYKQEAAAEAAKVKAHEDMLASYKAAGKSGSLLAGHCKTLIGIDKQAEKNYETLAKEHEAMAKAAK